MKIHHQLLIASLVFLTTSIGWSQTAPVTLKAAINEALSRTETRPLAASAIRVSEESRIQARAGFLPSLTASGAKLYQQDQQTSSVTTSSGLGAREQSTVKLTLNQNLFKGFKDASSERAASALIESTTADAKDRERLLAIAVSDAFYQVLTSEQDLQDLSRMLSLSEDRSKDLRSRVSVGRTRRGELLAAQAQIESVRAQIEIARSTLKDARENFAFLTGLESQTKLVDSLKLPQNLPSVDAFLKNVEARPDVEARRQKKFQFEEAVSVVKAGHWPSLDLAGNYYFERSAGPQGVNWDLGLSLTFPIYQGGVIQSEVRSAVEQVTQGELALEQTRRQAHSEIRRLYSSVSSYFQATESLERAVKAAETNHREQQRDYRFGLVTNLDVIQALATFIDSQRQLNRARYQAQSSYVKLQLASGHEL